LAREVGGVALLAERLGISVRTLRRWANERTPAKRHRMLIQRVAEDLDLPTPLRRSLADLTRIR
jgi:hypothetical protein